MSHLEDMIQRCDQQLNTFNKQEAAFIVTDYVLGYQKQIKELTNAEIVLADPQLLDQATIRSIRTLLITFKEKRDHELAVAQANAGVLNVTNEATSNTTVSINATFNNTMSQIWSLPDNVLSTQQKEELASLLKDVESAKDKSKLKRAGKAVCDFLFDKAIEAIPIVLPFVMQAVQGSI